MSAAAWLILAWLAIGFPVGLAWGIWLQRRDR